MSPVVKAPAKKTTRREAGKLGGFATKKKMGRSHFVKIGRVGGSKKRAKK